MCAGLNNLFSDDAFENELVIPAEVGTGYYRRIKVNPALEIVITDVTLLKSFTVGGGHDYSMYSLSFCLGDPLKWWVKGNKGEYVIEAGENYIFNGSPGTSFCNYYEGQRFHGISILMDPEQITGLVGQMGDGPCLKRIILGKNSFSKSKFSVSIKRILNEMSGCRYRGSIKKMYLEGKVLELLAVYAAEAVMERETDSTSISLSATDMDALGQARRILEQSIADPPTIGKLARLVCLNEFKLKRGFKELFGMPVHAYVIDQRLETARLLLEDNNLSVIEAALQVGYSDPSHFAEKFRKKFGINPSEYAKEKRSLRV